MLMLLLSLSGIRERAVGQQRAAAAAAAAHAGERFTFYFNSKVVTELSC
jgi:hypothetical protein